MEMLARIGAAYAAETFKVLRQRKWYAGPGLALAISAGMAWLRLAHQTASGYQYIADAVSVSVCSAGLLLVLVFSAALVAPEADSGVLRGVLARPVLRRELIVAKWLVGCTYAAVLLAMGAGGAWAAALLMGNLTGISYGGELIHSESEMRVVFLGAVAASLAPLAAAVSFGLMFSVLARTAGGAFLATFTVFVGLDAIKYPLGIAPYVFTTHIETPWSVFRARCDGMEVSWLPDLWYCLGDSAGFCVVCLSVAVWAFGRRNFA